MSLSSNELLLAAAAFIAVAFGTLALFFVWESVRDWRRRRGVRVRLESDGRRLAELAEARAESVLKPREDRAASPLDQVLARIPHVADLSLTLERARVGWTPGMFAFLTLGMGVAAMALGWTLMGGWAGGLVGLAVGGSLPRLWVSQKKAARLRRFEENFPQAVDLLARATRAGHPFAAGIAMVGAEGPEVVAEEFRQVSEEHRLGMPLEDALWGLVDRVELVDVRIFTSAVLIQREVGGNLAEILDKLGQTVRARFTIRRQLRVYTAQGRMSGYVLAILPLVIGGALYLLNPEYVSTLWQNVVGQVLVGVALALQVIGYLWIQHIVNIEI